jgi:hypothetical protein
MSRVITIDKIAYQIGRNALLHKLGLEAGSAPYVRKKLRDSEVDLVQAKRSQEAWEAIDKAGSDTTDLTRTMPESKQRRYQESAIEEAFDTNESLDSSSCSEPAMTQPHGPKTANAPNPFNVGRSLQSSIKAPRNAFNQMAPKMPSMPKVTDIRSNKPPGMNLQHDLATTATNIDTSLSWGSPQKRMEGFPGQ